MFYPRKYTEESNLSSKRDAERATISSSLEFTRVHDCKEKAKLVNTSPIEADIQKLKDELFPPIISETPSNGTKRSREEVQDDNIENGHNADSKKPAM